MREVPKSEFKYKCTTCQHCGAETTSDVACCNCCGEESEEGMVLDFYAPDTTPCADKGKNEVKEQKLDEEKMDEIIKRITHDVPKNGYSKNPLDDWDENEDPDDYCITIVVNRETWLENK